MGRLIDADKLKVYLQEYLHYGHAIPWVDEQPTAYDVEKVVAELEELLKLAREAHRSEEGMNDEYSTIILERYRGHIEMLKTAIDIVKRGGVE